MNPSCNRTAAFHLEQLYICACTLAPTWSFERKGDTCLKQGIVGTKGGKVQRHVLASQADLYRWIPISQPLTEGNSLL